MTTAKMLFLVILILGVTGTGVLMGIAKAWVETTPALDLSAFDAKAKTSFIYNKYGTLVTDFKGVENRIAATWDEIPENLKNAVIAVEDQRFLTHNGVDIRRILSALLGNLLNNAMQGGSTITQQLIKQTMLTPEQNYKRKLQEAYLALQLEKEISKEDILLQYLNVIYLGGSSYGVKVAALDYFGKNLQDLSLRECAALARTIRDPYGYNPRSNYYRRNTPEKIEDGTDHVLSLMFEQGLITEAEYNQAKSEKLTVLENSTFESKLYDNAYYVEYAIYDVVTKMLRAENLTDTQANRSAMESRLRTGGYKIYTALDPDIQKAAQTVVSEWTGYPDTRNAKDKVHKASLGNGEYLQVSQPQAAAAVVDWHTGELQAIIGGRAEPIQKKQLNRAYQKPMPVGSSLKPLSVYGPALDLGNSPGSPVINAPLRIEGWTSERGYPSNYEGGGYTGVETMRKAMIKSHNNSAAHALFDYVGIENSVNYLLKLGISRDHISATGAGLALGASGVSVIELAGAFGAVANGGRYLEPYAFTQVLYPDGSVYLDARQTQVSRQVFKDSTAYMLLGIMKACVGPNGTGQNANFGNITVAGKTGTNSDYRGVTFAGVTPYYAGAVWIGCDTYAPLVSNASGGKYAAPLWAAIMKKIHDLKGATTDKAIMPGTAEDYNLRKVTVCAVSGMKPTRACVADVNNYGLNTDYFLAGTEPTETCNMHRTIKLCTRSRKVPTEACTSIKTYGTIYLPEGHPLRYADFKQVQEYFKGASTDKTAATIGYCDICGKSGKGNDSSLDDAIIAAQTQINRAMSLIDTGNLTGAQRRKLQALCDKADLAIAAGNLKKINTIAKQLKTLLKKFG